MLGYIRFTSPPKTRDERAAAITSGGLADKDVEMRRFLVGVLQAYAVHGEGELSRSRLATFLTARYGSIADAKAKLGDVAAIKSAFVDLQRALYAD